MRDVIEHRLDNKHALRPAEATKRSIRYRMRLASVRDQCQVFQVVGIVTMEHRAIIDGTGQIG